MKYREIEKRLPEELLPAGIFILTSSGPLAAEDRNSGFCPFRAEIHPDKRLCLCAEKTFLIKFLQIEPLSHHSLAGWSGLWYHIRERCGNTRLNIESRDKGEATAYGGKL